MAMLRSLATSLLFATTAFASVAELQAQLPKCSLKCIVEGAAEHGCSVADMECQCTKLEAMIKTVSPCLVKAGCELEDLTETSQIVNQICLEEMGGNVTAAGAASPTATVIASTETPAAAPHILQRSTLTGLVAAAAAAVLL